MAKSSFVLRALKILGLEEMLKLSEVLHVKQTSLKKAAGEELIVWDDAPTENTPRHPREEAKVLEFQRKKTIHELPKFQEAPEPKAKEEEPVPGLITSDLVLWQRELSKQTPEAASKTDAFKGYRKSTEMYVVKTSTPEGKDKIRFASTNGVLVNKKQA